MGSFTAPFPANLSASLITSHAAVAFTQISRVPLLRNRIRVVMQKSPRTSQNRSVIWHGRTRSGAPQIKTTISPLYCPYGLALPVGVSSSIHHKSFELCCVYRMSDACPVLAFRLINPVAIYSNLNLDIRRGPY